MRIWKKVRQTNTTLSAFHHCVRHIYFIQSNLPTHELLLQNGLRICELAIWLTKHVELLRVIPIPRQYFRVLEPKLSSYCKKPAFFVHILGSKRSLTP